jgi:uncharacterized membrane protein
MARRSRRKRKPHGEKRTQNMKNRRLRKTVAFVFGLFTIASISLGILMLAGSYQNYEDPQVNTLLSTVVSIALVLLPITILFVYKAVRSYRSLNTTYGLPDLPTRSLLLAGGSIILLALIVVIVTMYFFVLHSPS